MPSSLAHSSLKVHCSYRLKFFVAKNYLRSSSLSNCSLLGSRFARSCSTRPFQRSKYTEGVALRMRISIAVQGLHRFSSRPSLFPGTERTGTDRNSTLKHGTDQRSKGYNIACASSCASTEEFNISRDFCASHVETNYECSSEGFSVSTCSIYCS